MRTIELFVDATDTDAEELEQQVADIEINSAEAATLVEK